MQRTTSLSLVASLFLLTSSAAVAAQQVTVAAGKHDRANVPVRELVQVSAALAKGNRVALVDEDDRLTVGQLTEPGLLARGGFKEKEGLVIRELHFVVDSIKAGQSRTYAILEKAPPEPNEQFAWHDTEGEYSELRFGARPVLRYMYAPLDDSSPQRREATYKVFHHVFNPAGTEIVTKGPGGRYTHHRGLFFGFSRISYEGSEKVDTWHCKPDAYLSHEKFLASEAGPVVGRHLVAVGWHGTGKKVFADEAREMSVYHVPGGTLIEFASRLRSKVGPLKLDGDPQHAGFQFRASNEVADKTNKETYYLRTDGKGKPGETRNWPKDKGHADLPWNAMSFVVGGNRYTAVYLDRPENPKEARYSERDYGRFGSYFVKELGKSDDDALEVNYRIWLQEGEMTLDQVQALSDAFVDQPTVVVK